jgi:F-box domain
VLQYLSASDIAALRLVSTRLKVPRSPRGDD